MFFNFTQKNHSCNNLCRPEKEKRKRICDCCCQPSCSDGIPGPAGPQGPIGPQGPAGAAATIRIGSVTTGEPGTPAEVTNSGTEQNAVLDFTIPRGENGGGEAPAEILSAYSTPPQAVSDNAALVFDRNFLSHGQAISHSINSDTFTINEPGVYFAEFNGNFAPALGTEFPSENLIYLEQNGTPLPGGAGRNMFHAVSEIKSLAFSEPLEVTAVPANIQVFNQGNPVICSDISLTIFKIGKIEIKF